MVGQADVVLQFLLPHFLFLDAAFSFISPGKKTTSAKVKEMWEEIETFGLLAWPLV